MDEIENSPLGQYLKKLADRADKARKENKLLKGQASPRRPGAGPVKKGTKSKKQKNPKGPNPKTQQPRAEKGLEVETPAPKKTTPNQPRKVTFSKKTKRGNPNPGGHGKSKKSRK